MVERLFVGRENKLSRLTAAVRAGVNSLVICQRGHGLTSTLYALARMLDAEERPVAFVDGRPIESSVDLLRSAGLALPTSRAYSIPLGHHDAIESAIGHLTNRAEAVGSDTPPVIIIDGLNSRDVCSELFGRWRDSLWAIPVTWVVGLESRTAAAALDGPAESFWDLRVVLGPLRTEQIAELLRRRAAGVLDEHAVSVIAEHAGGSPREALRLAADWVTEDDPKESLTPLEVAAAQVGRSGTMLLAELQTSGPASASDEELQRRMGWGRARLSQVLRDLERAGLVTALEGPANGVGGRPRRLYVAKGRT